MRAPSVHAIGAAQLVAWGAAFYAIPPLLPRIADGVSASPATLSVAMTVGLAINAVASLGVASWIHRRGARMPMTIGSVAGAAALAMLASSTSPRCASTALAMLGAAHAALLYEPAFAAVSTQTADPGARTRAIQVITFWGGWAALWALPTASFLGGTLGWRATLLLLGVLLGITIRVHARLPAPAFTRSIAANTSGASISLGLAAAFSLGSFATTAVAVNGLLVLAARDVSHADAATVFALLAPPQVFGRVWFLRHRGRLARRDAVLPFVLVGAGLCSLLGAPRTLSLLLFILLFGSGTGLLTTIRAAIVVARTPAEHVAKHLGTYSFVTSLARACAPAASVWLHATVGYELALVMLAAMALVAALLVWRTTSCACAGVPREPCDSWLDGSASCAVSPQPLQDGWTRGV